MADEKNKVEYTCTRITPAMTISGDITSTDNILIEGPVYGNVQTSANITAKNLIVGNISADSAVFEQVKIKGNIKLNGTLAVNDKSIIVGDINANALKLDGKVHGSIDLSESALLSETALLVGNISAQHVATQTGARINGIITTKSPHSSVNIDEEFDLGDIENHTKRG